MQTSLHLSRLISCLVACAPVSPHVHAQPAFTEITSPDARTSAQGLPAFTELISPNARSEGRFGGGAGSLPDLTRDGVGEFYVFGENRVYVYDGDKLEILYTVAVARCGVNRTEAAGDLNGDGISELLAGGACANNFSGTVWVVDGTNGEVLYTLTSPNPVTNNGFFGNDLKLLHDMTGDGKEDWLIHQLDYSSKIGRAYLFDSQTRKSFRTIQNTEPDHKFHLQIIEVSPDLDGDNRPELLVGGWEANIRKDGRVLSRAGRAIVRSVETGKVLYELHDPEPEVDGSFGAELNSVGDLTGDAVPDIAVGAPFKESGTGAIYFFSGANGHWLRTLRSPQPQARGRFGWVLEPLPDQNGDGVPELWTPEDGAQRTYVYDGATGTLIKTLEFPGPVGPLFFIATVRQEAAPGIRAHLFASQFAEDTGRVFYMPFSALPKPLRLKPMESKGAEFRLQLNGEPGLRLQIQATSDFNSWVPAGQATLGAEPLVIEDPAGSDLPRRFYRAVQVQ